MRYVAFLRGINVGGHRTLKMSDVEGAFKSLGFKNVKTFLASGNIYFEASKTDITALTKIITQKLERRLKHKIGVILRSMDQIQKIAQAQPFKGIRITPATRLFVTFLAEDQRDPRHMRRIDLQKGFRIIRSSPAEIFSVLVIIPGTLPIGFMSRIEKELGKNITTRSWNTVLKISRHVLS